MTRICDRNAEDVGRKLAERLSKEPSLVPLFREPQEIARFADFELASFVDIRGGEPVDPDELQDATVRNGWMPRALDEGERLDRPFDLGRRPYWIAHHGERIGTIAFSVKPFSQRPTIEVSSLCVRPRYRRRGWASRLVGLLKTAAFDVAFERVSLCSEWSNQNALMFYCQLGMWVRSWKDSVDLYFAADKPRWHMETQGNQTRFLVEGRQVAVAENLGHRLGWQLAEGVDDALKWDLEATAAVQLAVLGWPIIRSDELWQKQIGRGFSDCGSFEGLAHRIRGFERYARSKGWTVPPPNPSFLSLPTLAAVTQETDRFHVVLTDDTKLQIPFDTLDPMPTKTDPLQSVRVIDDEVVYRLGSGAEASEDIDHILWLNQSSEHLEEMMRFYREMRQSRLDAEKRRV